jgi:hypothetical protein
MKIPEIPKLSKRTWALIVAILLLLAAIPGLGLIRFTTGHPFFCLSCHENQDVPARWLPSRAHPASVDCLDCHTSGSNMFFRKYSASDELMNQKCLSCHSTIPGGEQTPRRRSGSFSSPINSTRTRKSCVSTATAIWPTIEGRHGPIARRWRPATNATRPILDPRPATSVIRLTWLPQRSERVSFRRGDS